MTEFVSGYMLDTRNEEKRHVVTDIVDNQIHRIAFDDSGEYKISIKLYELFCKRDVITMASSLSPGFLLKKIILGEITSQTISEYVTLFTKQFEKFKKPQDMSERTYLIQELTTNFYRFYADPAIWIYKPDSFIDVDENAFISETKFSNDKSEVIVKKLSNFITMYEIMLKNITLTSLGVYYRDNSETMRERYQQFKYKIVYNNDLYPLEKLTNSKFTVKNKHFYVVKQCTLWGNRIKNEAIPKDDELSLTLIERFLQLKYHVYEV